MLVDGNWSPWQPWGECSVSCGVGERTRARSCNNPAPSNKGRSCPGDSTQLSRCNIQPCPGKKKKKKTCLLAIFQFYKLKSGFRFFHKNSFAVCLYSRTWVWLFILHAALFVSSGGPQKARGNIIGTINDVEFGIAFLNATIFNDISGGRVIHATITNIPRSLGQSQDFFSISRSQISILTIILSWSSLIHSRPWNEETDLSAESHLLDHSTGDWRGRQRLQPYRRHLQTRDPSGVCNRWVQLVFKSSKALFKIL